MKSILNKKSMDFLETYLNNAAPTGYEWTGQKLWMDYLKPYVDEFITDTYGTAVGVINPKAKYKVIDLMEDQKKIVNMGGTMRLGAYDCHLEKTSLAAKAYGRTKISERHRHRFEFNDRFKKDFEENGMRITGINPDTQLAEVVEVENHPYFVVIVMHELFRNLYYCWQQRFSCSWK